MAARRSHSISASQAECEQFYQYTSGRWLWDEEERRRERYKRFNVPALQRIAAKCTGAQHCLSMVKLAEGGFNKVFRLRMDNGSSVIARIPQSIAGSILHSVASEVATMNFVANILAIPVPNVLSWSARADNPVQSEYILMEEAKGVQLANTWDQMELESKVTIVEQLVQIQKKLLSVSFSKFGNLYFRNDDFKGYEGAELLGDFDDAVKTDIRKKFVIGPVAERAFWEGARRSMDLDRGPWRRPDEFIKAIARREIAWLDQYANQDKHKASTCSTGSQSSPQAHIELYKKFEALVDGIVPPDNELTRPTLWHWDLHAANIFTQENQVTSLIDWQDVWAGPLLFQVQHPRLVNYNGKLQLRLPPEYDALPDGEEKQAIKTQVERSILLWSYEQDSKQINPALYKALHFPHGRTRKDTVDFSENTWENDIIPFRQCLIRMHRHWSEMVPDKPCPVRFDAQELDEHIREGEGWNESADFWESVSHLVKRDGWTSNEDFHTAKELFADFRDLGLRNLTGEERSKLDEQTSWLKSDGR